MVCFNWMKWYWCKWFVLFCRYDEQMNRWKCLMGRQEGWTYCTYFTLGTRELAKVKGQALGGKSPNDRNTASYQTTLWWNTQRPCCPSEGHSCVKPQGGSGEIRQQHESLLYVIAFNRLYKMTQYTFHKSFYI